MGNLLTVYWEQSSYGIHIPHLIQVLVSSSLAKKKVQVDIGINQRIGAIKSNLTGDLQTQGAKGPR